ncbi:MAG: CBS domain-containing protein [bacterium]
MKDIPILDMIVPLSSYATVSQEEPLSAAILALEAAQAGFDQSRYRHRAILVFDENKQVVGKLSQMDIIKALEPDFAEKMESISLDRFGISVDFLSSTLDQYEFWNRPLKVACREACSRPVKEFMYTPAKQEFIRETASLQEAIHRLVIGQHHSLLVTRDEEIVGVLRLTDVFTKITEVMKEMFEREESPE